MIVFGFFELLLIGMSVCAFALAIMDITDNQDADMRTDIGWAFIVFALLMIFSDCFLAMIYILPLLYRLSLYLYKKLIYWIKKCCRKERVVPLKVPVPLTKRIELEENVYKTQGALFGSVIGARIEKPNLIAPPKEKDELDLIEPYEDPDEKKPGLEVPKAQEDQGGSQPNHRQGNVERVSHTEGA